MMSLADLWRGIYRRPWKTTQYIFTSFSVIFTLVKAITYFVPAIKIEGLFALTAAIVISTVFGLRKVWKPSRIEIPVAHCNTTIEIIFGDLFKQDGIRAIAVNEYFDSDCANPILLEKVAKNNLDGGIAVCDRNLDSRRLPHFSQSEDSTDNYCGG